MKYHTDCKAMWVLPKSIVRRLLRSEHILQVSPPRITCYGTYRDLRDLRDHLILVPCTEEEARSIKLKGLAEDQPGVRLDLALLISVLSFYQKASKH